MGLFLGSLFYSIDHMSIFMPIACCFDHMEHFLKSLIPGSQPKPTLALLQLTHALEQSCPHHMCNVHFLVAENY